MTCHSISRGRDIEALSACIRSSALLIADRLSPIGGARTVHMEKFNRETELRILWRNNVFLISCF